MEMLGWGNKKGKSYAGKNCQDRIGSHRHSFFAYFNAKRDSFFFPRTLVFHEKSSDPRKVILDQNP